MSVRHLTSRLTVEELLERAASAANLAMLRTYAEPSSVQVAAINECTHLLESKLRSLPSHDAYTCKRILAQLNINRFILAPIRRLPKELLIEIFLRVANSTPLRTLNVAVNISRVCAVWRAVAHGISQLWTRLIVKSLSDFDQYCELFLSVPTKPNLPGLRCDDPKLLAPLWDRIEPYASSWRSLTLVGRLCTLPNFKVLYMENLERLVVDAYEAPVSPDLSVLDFVVAPRLQHIALTLDAFQSERQLHVPVTRALSSLEITAELPFPVTFTLPLLQECADTLQSLTIKIRQVSNGAGGSYPTSASSTFGMQALTYLSFADSACALLDYISAPLVEQIVLSNVPAYASRSLLVFLARDEASRSLLILRVYKAEERDLFAWIPCLQLMDNLLQLHFDELLSNGEFLQRLVLREDKPSLLPSLRGIAISHIFRRHPELHDAISDVCTSREQETTYCGKRAWLLLDWIKD